MKIPVFLILLIAVFQVTAQDNIKVLATNSWTAAYAKAAGLENIKILAPETMLHPAEYELSIFDMKNIMEADIVIYAGYEVAIVQMKKMLILNAEKYFQIETGYTEEMLERSITKIAVRANTLDSASVAIKRIKNLFSKARLEVERCGLKGEPVIVHTFQEPFIRDIGLDPVVVIGPAPLEIYQIVDIAQMEDAAIIIDNIHNPVTKPLREIITDVPFIELLNFPGQKGTTSLESVLEYNLSQIGGVIK